MKLRHAVILALVPLSLGACKKKAAAPGPTPASAFTDAQIQDRARADSIAAYEAAERERLARAGSAGYGSAASAREVLTEIVYFEYDSAQLSPEAEDRLREKAGIMRANPSIRLRIEGHADERGSTEYNLALGQARAESVRRFLYGYGISMERLTTISYGKERPLVEGAHEVAWARNRRAEFVLTGGDLSSTPGVR